jgi:hypothetical protein
MIKGPYYASIRPDPNMVPVYSLHISHYQPIRNCFFWKFKKMENGGCRGHYPSSFVMVSLIYWLNLLGCAVQMLITIAKLILRIFAFNSIHLMTSSSTLTFSASFFCFIDMSSFHIEMSCSYQTNRTYFQTDMFWSKLSHSFQLSIKFLCIWTSPKLGHHFQDMGKILGSFSTADSCKWEFEAVCCEK